MAGEDVCGDACAWWRQGQRLVLAVADGLGHGEAAAHAAEAAMQCIGESLDCACEEIFARCDERLLNTRGVALAVVIVDLTSGWMRFGSVGNIRAMLLHDSRELRLGSARGIVGAGYKKLLVETLQLFPGDVLALFSDGLNELVDLRSLVSTAGISVQAQAQAMLDHCGRGDDDAGVLIYRYAPDVENELS